jgi:uncharacterized membrane protein
MEPLVKQVAVTVASVCELVAVCYVALGAIEALGRTAAGWRDYGDLALRKRIWLRFAATIALALEFALAADVARTVITPTWGEIGQLAAIATIRTLLNLFLERDLDTVAAEPAPEPRPSARPDS